MAAIQKKLEISLLHAVNAADNCNAKNKAVSIYEPPLFQGLPHSYLLTSNSPISIGMVALPNTMVTVLACGIHPSLIQGCVHSSTGNLISFYPTITGTLYCKQVMVP